MTCASCVASVEKAVKRLPGIAQARVNLPLNRAYVEFDPDQQSPATIATAINNAGFNALEQKDDHTVSGDHDHDHHGAAWKRRALLGIVLWLPVEATHWVLWLSGHHEGHVNWMTWWSAVAATIAMVLIGGAFFQSAWKALLHKTSNMDTLISMGASVAYLYSVVALIGTLAGKWELPTLYFMEAAGLLALISLGHWMEGSARDKAGASIRELMTLAPQMALRVKDPTKRSLTVSGQSEERTVAVKELEPGDCVLVKPGDKVPIDGVIVQGAAGVDESMLTGESVPVRRAMGDPVIGGTIARDGSFIVRVTRVGTDTALSQIVGLVEQAQSSKAPVQKLADTISSIFVPSVLAIAVLTAIGWLAYGHYMHWPTAIIWGRTANAVCSVLIIACPCALGLAVPAAVMVGTGIGAKRGILFRDIDALQAAEKATLVVFDKTGTLTRGEPRVVNVASDEMLQLAASVEQLSEHPLAEAIVREAKSRGLSLDTPENFKSEPGMGIEATLAGEAYLVGSAELLRSRGIEIERDADSAFSVVYIAKSGGTLLGRIELEDAPRESSAAAVATLHEMGLSTMLLSGDRQSVAERLGKDMKLGRTLAGVKPEGKAAEITRLVETHRVIMVGDGVNDAPAMAAASVGIAVGSGSDVAKQSAAIVLLGEGVSGVPASIQISRKTMSVIRQNLFFAFVYNVLAIPLAAFGIATPLIAAGAMALSDVTVLGNALRLRWILGKRDRAA